MPTFHEPYNPLHHGEEQPELFLRAVPFTLLVGVVRGKKKIVRERGRNEGNWSVFNNQGE